MRTGPGSHASGAAQAPGPAFWLLTGALLALGVLAWLTIDLDHPFLIATNSRALYVDEGFYSDAAQNFAKFGRWGFPYDFPHWAGAPFLTFIQSLVFPVFGASLETARLLSVVLSLITALAFYGIARASMKPAAAAALTLAGVLTINFVAHARSALVEPTAVCLAMLGLLAYVRMANRELAIPLSVALAFAAFFSKMYLLFTLGAVLGVWLLELVIAPLLARRAPARRPVLILAASLAAVGALYGLYSYLFADKITEYYIINRDKAPVLDLEFLFYALVGSLKLLPYNTKTAVYLGIILLGGVAATALALWPGTRGRVVEQLRALGRAELALGLWLVAGLVTIGTLNAPKPHYHFFAILPLSFAGSIVLKLVFPASLHTVVIVGAAVLHLVFQAPLYHQWSQKPQQTAIVDSSREVARFIEEQSDEKMIAVNGEYAAQLGLYSDRIFSLDVKWAPSYHYCRRIEFWKPRFHVNIIWPGSVSRQERKAVEECEIVDDTSVLQRFTLFQRRMDELVLSRIHYE